MKLFLCILPLRIESLADPAKEVLGVTGVAEQAVDQGRTIPGAKPGDVDLGVVPGGAAEDPSADTGVGREALEGGPTEGLLVVLAAFPEGAGPGENRLRRVPHPEPRINP